MDLSIVLVAFSSFIFGYVIGASKGRTRGIVDSINHQARMEAWRRYDGR